MNLGLTWACTPLALACASLSAAAQSNGSFTTSEAGCPKLTSDSGPVLYGRMPAGEWHLDGSSLLFESGGANWSMSSGGAFIPVTAGAMALSMGDDQVVGPRQLPFAFPYPGGAGATTAIDVNSNGRIYLESGTNTWTGGYQADGILPDFMAATPSICPLGVDLNPGAGGVVWVETVTLGAEQVAVITWDSVPEYDAGGSNTVQCQLWSSGSFVISFGETNGTLSGEDALVGVSAGGGAVDPGPSSILAPPVLSLTGTPEAGGAFTISATGVPVTSTLAILGVGLAAPVPPILLDSQGAPADCTLLIDQIVLTEVMTLEPPLASINFQLGYVPAQVGAQLECQAFIVDPPQGTPLPILVSDRGTLTIGTPNDLVFVIEGSSSYYGNPDNGGFFRLKSSGLATHGDIVRLEVWAQGMPEYFDVEGNAGLGAAGFFADGNGTDPASMNAYHGTDITTGLIYRGAQMPSYDGTGLVGWTGALPVGGTDAGYKSLTFDFTDFSVAETFGFDCDTDGGDYAAGLPPFSVKVTFAAATTLTQVVQPINNDRAEAVLIP